MGLVKGCRSVQPLQIYLCATRKKTGCRIVRLILNLYFTKDILSDTFLLFTNEQHAHMFLQYLNNQHENSLLHLNARLTTLSHF